MKHIINLSLVLLLLTTGTTTYAQWWGVKAGYNLSDIIYKVNNKATKDLFTKIPGFHIGLITELPLYKPVSIETGLFLTTKGYIESYSTGTVDPVEIKTNANFIYLDIPVMAKASFKMGGAKIYGVIGPYLGSGLGGEIKKTSTLISNGQSSTNSYDIKWGPEKGKDNFKRVDLGLNAGAGIDFRAVQLSILYGIGLRNLSENSANAYKVNNRVLGFSLAYKFTYGSLNSSDYKSRIKAVKRILKQDRLLNVVSGDKDWRVRNAAFDKLNKNSLTEISKNAKDQALIIAAKIRLNQTTWNNEFAKSSGSGSSLGDVIGAAALVNSPQPTTYDVVSACHKYITEGDVSRIPELINLLDRFGDESLGEDYMNCGNDELRIAGESWGRAHGYNIGSGNGSHRVRWGEKR
jgi:hypothetical protein